MLKLKRVSIPVGWRCRMDARTGRDYFHDRRNNSQWGLPTAESVSDVSPREEAENEAEDAARLEDSISSMPRDLRAVRRSLMPDASSWPFKCSAEARAPSGYKRYRVSIKRNAATSV